MREILLGFGAVWLAVLVGVGIGLAGARARTWLAVRRALRELDREVNEQGLIASARDRPS